MLIVISPAKTLDFETKTVTKKYSIPLFLGDSALLMEQLRNLSIIDLTKLMNISYGLAEKNLERYMSWQPPFTLENSKQAILAFNGDVYDGLEANNFTDDDFEVAQKHLRILSGLYGVLKPLDLIQAYRLEMSTKFKNPKGKNLYEFWNSKITEEINNALSEQSNKYLINLASNDYFKVILEKNIQGTIITPIFKENKDSNLRVVSFYAKKARGLMAKYIIKHRITNPDDIKSFDSEGYTFSNKHSNSKQWVFVR